MTTATLVAASLFAFACDGVKDRAMCSDYGSCSCPEHSKIVMYRDFGSLRKAVVTCEFREWKDGGPR